MDKRTAIYLQDIAFRANSLVDNGKTVPLSTIHEAIEDRRIIEWLSDSGADMSLLLSGEMDDVKEAVLDVLERVANAFKGRERRKMGVENNGLCLLIGVVFQALAIDED